MKVQWHMFVPLLVLGALAPPPASAQRSANTLVDSVLDCTRHEGGSSWVEKNVYEDGLLRFNYLHEPPKGNDPEEPEDLDNVYVVFWNQNKTHGEFLNFTLDRLGSRRVVTVTNEGQVYVAKGELDLDFFQGGEWTRDRFMTRIRKLYRAPVETIMVRDIKRTTTLCDSFLNPHPEWRTKAPAVK